MVRAGGYTVGIEEIPLDASSPATSGVSPYVALRLAANCRLQDPLSHLYVLIPALDLRKHYYIDTHEIEKLRPRSSRRSRTYAGAGT
ncbi:MAG: hypothetical protein ACWGMY_10065 [Hyphomicrobiaceae bacterium]